MNGGAQHRGKRHGFRPRIESGTGFRRNDDFQTSVLSQCQDPKGPDLLEEWQFLSVGVGQSQDRKGPDLQEEDYD